VSEPLTSRDDARVFEWNIGLTNMVGRASKSLADLTLDELRAGAARLRTKLLRNQPRVVCFNGKRIYDVFAGRTTALGVQPERVGESLVYVMPSTSPRGASYQKADKLRFFLELRRLVRDAARKTAAS
jgi:TDG/mug DNA glycosylase family protein